MKPDIVRILARVAENLPPIITVAASIYISILAQFRYLSTESLLSSIPTVLALLAVSELVARVRILDRIDKRTRKIEILEQILEGGSSVDKLVKTFKDDVTLDSFDVTNAKEVWVAGTVLLTQATNLLGQYEESLQKGCNLRFLLVAPSGPGIINAARRSCEAQSSESVLRQQLETSLRNLGYLRQKKLAGKCEVRVLDLNSSYGLFIVNPLGRKGRIFVRIYPYKSPFHSHPWIVLESERDRKWYKFFIEQFELMWKDARTWPELAEHS